MTDKELFDLIAKTWVDNGGDFESFEASIEKIKESILDLQEEMAWVSGDEFWDSHDWEWEDDYELPEDWDKW